MHSERKREREKEREREKREREREREREKAEWGGGGGGGGAVTMSIDGVVINLIRTLKFRSTALSNDFNFRNKIISPFNAWL